MARRDTPPLIAGRIHGIRVWELEWVNGDARLEAFNGTEWISGGRPTVATCRSSGPLRSHRAPVSGCACGLYAAHPHSSEFAFALLYDEHAPPLACIAGIVEAWGRVELHQGGFRAQYARPIALALVGAPAQSDLGLAVAALADRYASELLVLDDHEGLVEHCRSHGLGLSPEVVRSLLPEQSATEPSDRAAIRRRRPGILAERIIDALELAGAALLALVSAAVLFAVTIGVLAVIINAFVDEPDPPSFTAGHLEITDQALVRRGGEVRYVAIVRNTSAKRVAVATFARGEISGRAGSAGITLGDRERAEVRPTLLPGEAGAVIDMVGRRRLDGLADDARFEIELVARREPAPRRQEPFVLRSTDLNRDGCRLAARFEAASAVRGAQVALVARDRSGAISAGGTIELGRLPAGRSRHVLLRRNPDGCPRWLRNVEVYPHLLPRQALGAGD